MITAVIQNIKIYAFYFTGPCNTDKEESKWKAWHYSGNIGTFSRTLETFAGSPFGFPGTQSQIWCCIIYANAVADNANTAFFIYSDMLLQIRANNYLLSFRHFMFFMILQFFATAA